MVNTGLLILTNPAKVKKILPTINKHVLQTLYIQYFPEGHIIPVTETPLTNPQWKWPRYAQTVANIYTTTTVISPRLDVRVLLTSLKNPSVCIVNTKKPVEMVIFDQNYSQAQANTFIQDYLANASMDCKFIVCNGEKNQESQNESCQLQETKPYRNVVLGGTFDRLHNGHKIFLSEAVGRCTEKLTVGVTDTNMLTGKLLWELIESCPKRSMGVKDFLEDVEPHLIYNIVPINDMYGPTKDDPTFEMIVVSEETKKGADKINEVRMHNKLNQLDVHVVNLVVDETHREYEESKISSSNQRIRLLGSRLKVPKIGHKPLKPYIIGLTGGIASGKSSVAQKLEALGAGHVNCDKLAHDSYLPGNRCYKLIIEHFGSDILTDDGFIDRKALGDKVFQNKEELKKLNELLWPVILEDAKKEIGVLYEKGFDVIILEAAVLIQANWMHECHEIWTCIVPEKEAVNRLRERNALSEKEAKSRIQAQPSNLEQVEKANVVFCTLWSHEVTQNQVQKAWDELSAFMSQYKHS